MIGVFIIIVGVALSFFTYGISLVVTALIDLLIYRFVADVAICYECQAHFRGFEMKLQGFNLSLNDHYRAIRDGRLAQGKLSVRDSSSPSAS